MASFRFSAKDRLLSHTCGAILKANGIKLVKFKTRARLPSRRDKEVQVALVRRSTTLVIASLRQVSTTRSSMWTLATESSESYPAIMERTTSRWLTSSAQEKTLADPTLSKSSSSSVRTRCLTRREISALPRERTRLEAVQT